MTILNEATHAFEQTTQHIAAGIKQRFIAGCGLYTKIFFLFALALGFFAIAMLIASKSALSFGIFGSCTITCLLIAYVTTRFCAERKEEEAATLAQALIDECHATFDPFESREESLFIAANTARHLAKNLKGIEKRLCTIQIKPLQPAFEKLSTLIHRRGTLALRHQLLQCAIREIIEVIFENPINHTHHKKLGLVYLEVACLYANETDLSSHIVDNSSGDAYKSAVRHAAAQLRLAKELGSREPRLYEQLIECYGALKEQEHQLATCAELIEVAPKEGQALYCVGRRYFEHGRYAEGLKVYERLLLVDSERARLLLHTYKRYLAT